MHIQYLKSFSRVFESPQRYMRDIGVSILFFVLFVVCGSLVMTVSNFFSNVSPVLSMVLSYVFFLALSSVIVAIPLSYIVECTVLASKGHFSLPDWNFSSRFKIGLKLYVVCLVFSLISSLVTMTLLYVILGSPTATQYITLATDVTFMNSDPIGFNNALTALVEAHASQFTNYMLLVLMYYVLTIPLILIALILTITKNKITSGFGFGKVLHARLYYNLVTHTLYAGVIVFLLYVLLSYILIAVSSVPLIYVIALLAIVAYAVWAIQFFITQLGQTYGSYLKK